MKILVVDDEKVQRDALAGFLTTLKYDVRQVESAQKALALLYKEPADVVLTDYKMPYMTGGDLLKEIKTRHPQTIVIVITAYGTIETAVDLMKSGATDFITKPIDLDQLEKQLREIRFNIKSETTLKTKKPKIETSQVVVQDQVMIKLMAKAQKVSSSQVSVLITGETGTGKDVLAGFIHEHCTRSAHKMHTVNCAALPSNLAESELFGHVKGAFTGADRDRVGHIATAKGSTLFLDEIGELSLDIQVKLLRFLQNKEFQRVGSDQIQQADVRIIAATNIDLADAVKNKTFREDLFYRLKVINFNIPPLRERTSEILPLADSFLIEFAHRENRTDLSLTGSARQSLMKCSFPGNIRELRNIIERAVLLTDSSEITAEDLDLISNENQLDPGAGLNEKLGHLERELISKTLVESNGNQSECARRLEISERVLRYKIQKYGLRDK